MYVQMYKCVHEVCLKPNRIEPPELHEANFTYLTADMTFIGKKKHAVAEHFADSDISNKNNNHRNEAINVAKYKNKEGKMKSN